MGWRLATQGMAFARHNLEEVRRFGV